MFHAFGFFSNLVSESRKHEPYLFLTDQLKADALDTQLLLHFAKMGGTVLIAAETLSDTLANTLNIETEPNYAWWQSDTSLFDMSFAHPDLLHKTDTYRCNPKYLGHYFTKLDTPNTTILGGMDNDHPNFIRIKYGMGAFFLHSSPLLFSNYTAIQDSGAQYIARVFAHLPAPNITYWDEQYKPNRIIYRDTPLRYVLSIQSLRWAIYLSLFGLLLLLLFESKRRQRAIPIIEPLKNTTLDFARTIGMLYYQQGDHRDLAQKKVTHFNDYLRQKLFLSPLQFDREYYQLVAQKAQLPLSDIEAIFRLIVQVRTQVSLLPDTLIELNRRIDAFYAGKPFESLSFSTRDKANI